MIQKGLLLFVLFFTGFNSFARLKLPALISDGMILQRNQPVKIWGWELSGKEVIVSFHNKTYKSNPDKNKKWFITLDAAPAGGPYNMSISAGGNDMIIQHILLGDVWVCSGQSNMAFAMSRIAEKEAEDIAHSDNTNIREFHVKQQYSFQPEENADGEWKPSNPTNVVSFSAVAYYMAKNLYEKYKVPIGIIHSSWGGSPAEAWISEAGLKEFPNYLSKYNYYKDSANLIATIQRDKNIRDEWYKRIRDNDKGFLPDGSTWANPDFNASTWKTMPVPGFWENYGAPKVDGVVWARKEINLTKEQIQLDGKLELGMIDDEDTTYVNGVKVGSTSYKGTPRIYKVPAHVLREGHNVIAVRIVDKEGNGGFIKGKAYHLKTASQVISLEGNWQYNIGFSLPPLPVSSFTRMHYQPASLFNAMIAPLIPYTIKGFAWYQGEANAGKAAEYTKLLSDLINDWRRRWKQDKLPFFIVQLANYMEIQKTPSEGGWAWIREAQLKVSETLASTALAVTIDVGDANDIHPINKKEVGRRLAIAAGETAYADKTVVGSGPAYKSMSKKDGKIVLSFTSIGGGLIAKDGVLNRFAIAENDKQFVWASAKIEGDKVIVWNDAITNPVAVRYAWASNPEGCNLYNKDGLPASPFRTDNWDK